MESEFGDGAAKASNFEAVLTLIMPALLEIQDLRARIDELVAQLGDDIPQQKLARALMAKACDLALNEVGAMGAISMAEQAANLLAGRWTEETIRNYLQIKL